MKFNYILLVLIFCVSILNAQEDNSYRFSLKEAQAYAVIHNAQVLNAKLDVEIAKKKIWETTAIGLPQVNASASHNYNIDLPVTLVPAKMFNPQAPDGAFAELKFGTDHNTNLALTATQLIFSGEYFIGLKASKVYKELSVNQLDKTGKEIKEQIANTYQLILMAKERLQILKKNRISTQSLYEETDALYKAGLASEIDASQLKINLSTFENALKNAERQIQVAKDLLKIQLGIPRGDKLELTDSLEMLLEETDIAQMQASNFALENHFDYKIINSQERLQKLSMDREKTTFLPTVSAFYTHQQSMMSNDFQVFSGGRWFGSNMIGLKINMPIFSSGQRLSKVSQAKIELEKVQNLKQQVSDNISAKVIRAKMDMQTASDSYHLQKENRKLSERIYKEYEVKYKNGIASSMELTQSQMQYLNTEQSYFQSIFELLDAKNRLMKALGL